MANIEDNNTRIINVIHVNRRDTIERWEGSSLPLVYGEIVLGYEETGSGSGDGSSNAFLSEIRAGASSGALCWKELKTYVPVFPVQGQSRVEILASRANKVLGFDSHGLPTYLDHSGGGVLTVISKRSNPEDNPGQNDALYIEQDSNGYILGINNDGWEITCN